MQISSASRSGVIGVEAGAIVGFHELQPLLVEGVQGTIVAVEVVENPELHLHPLQRVSWTADQAEVDPSDQLVVRGARRRGASVALFASPFRALGAAAGAAPDPAPAAFPACWFAL
jgi:hypothetical protein